METGVPTSPVTLRPKRVKPDAEALMEKALEDEATLREKAEDINFVFSDQGQRIIDLVSDKLENRVSQLIKEDPEAMAYAKILTELKHKVNGAKNAIDELYRKYLTKK